MNTSYVELALCSPREMARGTSAMDSSPGLGNHRHRPRKHTGELPGNLPEESSSEALKLCFCWGWKMTKDVGLSKDGGKVHRTAMFHGHDFSSCGFWTTRLLLSCLWTYSLLGCPWSFPLVMVVSWSPSSSGEPLEVTFLEIRIYEISP